MLLFRSFPHWQDLHRWEVEEMKIMLEDMAGIVQLRLDDVAHERKQAEKEQQDWEHQQKWEAQELLVTQQEQRLEELENWKRECHGWEDSQWDDTAEQDRAPSGWKDILIEMQRKQIQETRDRIEWERLTSSAVRIQPEWQTREFKEWTQKLIRLDQKEENLEEEHKKRIQALTQAELDFRELDLLANIWLKWQEDELQGLDGGTLDQLKRRAKWSSPKLMDRITANESCFKARSSYLDALLVFAGLFSAILSAFLIHIHQGLQEELLLQILHQLQIDTHFSSFQPPSMSFWVTGLWFSSLTSSMLCALTIILAKSLGRWVITKNEAETIFHSPEYPRRRYTEIQHFYVHSMFQQKLVVLTTIASILIYVAVILFFAGLAVLLFSTTQKSIAISFLVITSTIGTVIFGVA